ncbi:MAG: hypothetical protein JW797_19860 [Bradymonadales bacterium]|nr:hypothetical protein [Bradymonadales bacterium]
MSRTMLATLTVAFAALLLVGCAEMLEPGLQDTQQDELHIVDPGKADNYYSNVATEYEITGNLPVAMTAEQYEDEEVRRDLVTRRLTAVGLYLTTYLTDKFHGIDSNDDGEITDDEVFFHNLEYGGFHAMVRNYSVESVAVSGDGESGYIVDFAIDVAGPPDMLSLIPGEQLEEEGGGLLFDLRMPAGATVDPSNVPRRDTRRFDPDTYEGELETVQLTARPLPAVQNAYPQFASFFSDGLYDITLFYGHDYNESRSDLREAREAYDKLRSLRFTSPVERFDDLKADSGPFTRTAVANGQEIDIEVRIFHSDMFEGQRREQHDLALAELVARDVFFYNGHAGPYYGFYLDADGAAQVNYWEFKTAPFQENRQQLFVAQGCQTYSQYADMIYANPNKSEATLDIITTVNYSYGSGTMGLLSNLLSIDYSGNHKAVDFYQIIRGLNSDWINSYRDVFYGVMGIDGNPQLHPYANLAAIGRSCELVAECGDPNGNVCAGNDQGTKECGAVSLAATACPDGTRFRQIASGYTIQGGACFAIPE